MKYENLIRKIFKNYKSKRELKQELEQLKNRESVKIVREPLELIDIKCCRSIDPLNINLLNQSEKDLAYERIMHDMQREMFDCILDSEAFKIYKEFDNYEFKEKFVGFIRVVK